MTFTYDGEFDLPNDEVTRNKEVPAMVLEKMETHKFQLVDFNLTENYDREHSKVYINDPFIHRSVLEIRLDLAIKDMKNREAIFNRCLEALQRDEVSLDYAFENDNKQKGMLQSIIIFEMKERLRAQA
jgi:hypothetical protein